MVLELFLWGAGKQRDRGARKWDGNMGWERASALQPSMRLQVRPGPHDGPVVHRSDRCGRLAQFCRGPFETKAPCCKAPSKASALQYLHLHRPIKTTAFWAPDSVPRQVPLVQLYVYQLHLHLHLLLLLMVLLLLAVEVVVAAAAAVAWWSSKMEAA